MHSLMISITYVSFSCVIADLSSAASRLHQGITSCNGFTSFLCYVCLACFAWEHNASCGPVLYIEKQVISHCNCILAI